ncbi:TPA: phage head-binding domain-containing protein [Escherichia coli]
MTDITANVIVSMPSQLFTMARSFKAVANGKIYIGKIDTDPVNPENQIQVYIENEDGSHVPVSQPIIINAAGYPVYNGQIAKFVTVQGHSMAVYDAYGAQQFYFPNVLKYDPDQLKLRLEASDGMKIIGKCQDIETLRKIEPDADGQIIILERAVAGGPLLNVEFYHDANDSSADDGISTFTTSTGKVWKQVGFDGYNVLIAGYVPSSNNLSSVIQNIIDTIVGKIVSTGRVRGHNRTIIIPADCGITNDFNRHIMASSVNIPSFFTLKIEGHHVFSFTGNTSGFIIGNDKWPGLTWSVAVAGYNDGHWESGHRVFVCDERVDIVGSSSGLSDDIETYGIYVGNDPVEWGTPDVRDITISDLFITGFKYGQGFGSVSTYSVFFEKLHFEKNGRCIFVATAKPSNAGETFHYTDCIFSQSEDNHIHHMRAAWNMSFHKCHFGFAKFAVFRLGANVIYSKFDLYDCWVEGFEWLVYQTNRYEGGANILNFYGGFIYPQSAIGTWPGPRPILFAGDPPSGGVCYSITMFGTKLTYSKKGGYCSVCLGGANNGIDHSFDINGEGYEFSFTPKGGGDNSYPKFPFSHRNTLNGNSIFNGTKGSEMISDASSGTFVQKSGSPSVVYGDTYSSMGNLQSIRITMNNTSDVVRLISRSRIYMTRGDRLFATCSILPLSAVGDIKVSTCIINYSEPDLTVSGSAVISTPHERGISSLNATTENVATYASQDGYPLTNSDFVGCYPVTVTQDSTGGGTQASAIYHHSLPGLVFTGFTGAIEVLLPLWWI